MKLPLHRRVRADVDEMMDHYEQAEHPELAQDFYHELRRFMLDEARRALRAALADGRQGTRGCEAS